MMDKTIRDDYQISTLKKSFKRGKTEIINKYVKKIHHLQNQKGDASKVAKCQRKAKKLQEEVAVLQKIKPRDVCKMALSKDKDCKNVLSQDGVSLEDRCHALIANHSAVQAALEKLHSESRCLNLPDENADSASTERTASKTKKRKKRKHQDDVSDSSEKENHDSGEKHPSLVSSDSASKRPLIVYEEDRIVESLCERKSSKRKKILAEDDILGKEKGKRERLKKGKPPRIKENGLIIKEQSVEEMPEDENAGSQSTEGTVVTAKKQSLKKGNPRRIKKEKHLGEEIPEMQDEDENTSFPPTERCIVKAKKRKKKRKSYEKEENDLMLSELPGMTDNLNTNFPPTERCIVKAKKRKKKSKSTEREENDLMSSELPGMTDYLKDQEDDSEGSEKENRSISFSNGIAPKTSHIVHKDSELDENLELLCQAKSKKRKVSIIDYQLREDHLEKEKTKKQCLVKEKLPERTELQNSTIDKLHEFPTSPDRTSEINDKEPESINHLESQQQTKPSKRRKSSKKEDQLEEENTQVQCFEEKLPRKKRKSFSKENRLVDERIELQDSSLNELQEIIHFSKDDNKENNSEGLGGKNHKTSRKRKPSVSDQSNNVTKKLSKDSELLDFLPKKPKQKKLLDAYRAKQFTPDNLIELMYQLDLSILCSLRKSMNENLYPSLTLTFGDPEISKFSDIVIRHQDKSVHICVESVDSFIPSNIDYSRLFNKNRQSCSLNSYFGSFVKHVISKSDALHSVDHLIIYTNAGLDLTEEKELKRGLLKNFYPFRFKSINVEDHDVIKTFLCTRNTFHKFYQFSQDETTRKELLKQLKISPTMQKSVGKNFPSGFEKEIKKAFLDKLVFAVEQPNREELNCIVRTEMKQKGEHSSKYTKLQKKILSKLEKHRQNVSGIIYEFNLFVLILYDMFVQKNMISLKIDGGSSGASFGITIDYKGRTSYIKAHYAEGNISYNHLFSSKRVKNRISLDEFFTLFVDKLGEGLRYFIIYTNGDLELTEEMELKKSKCRDFYPFKFDNVDIQKKKYKVLRNCSSIDGDSIYQFSKEEKTRQKLLSLLKLPPTLETANGLNDMEIKEQFLDKLIFVVNQPNWKKLNGLVIEKLVHLSEFPCNSEELFEIAMRWLESYDTSPLRKGLIEKFLEDIRNNMLSYQDIQYTDMAEIYRFAKSIVGRDGTFWFRQFLRFLLKDEGRQCLGVLKKEGIKLSIVSTLLSKSGSMACKGFLDLYNCLFDKEGNKTHYMKNLEGAGLYICTLSSILKTARSNIAVAFTDLYDLWFDFEGEKTKYLRNILENGIDLLYVCNLIREAGTTAAKAFKDLYDLWIDCNGKKMQWFETLEKEGINPSNLSSILSGAGNHASKAFKDLYDVWFDEKGNKKECLNVIKKEGISLSNIASLLNKSGRNAAEAFTDLYDLWFDEQGNKKLCLKALEREKISLSSITSILHSPGSCAAKAFDNFYRLLFDEQGNKKPCLEFLGVNGINISHVSSILKGSGCNASKAFKDLYDLWFDEQGNKKQCFKILENKGIKITHLTGFMIGTGSNASEAFSGLYNLWFKERGKRTQYLKTLEKEGINLNCISSILRGSGAAVSIAFKELYDVWFDKHGNKNLCLKTIEKEGIRLSNITAILKGAGSKAAKTFRDFYDLWFDVEGNKTNYLKTLEKKGVRLSNVSSILCGAGHCAPKAFKDLYDLLFDVEGRRTQYLKNLKKEGMSLSHVSSILNGAGSKAPTAFKKLYHLWFDDHGNETQCLKTLAANGVNLSDLSCTLSATGTNASTAFKELYNLFFDEQGNKTKYVTDLEEQGMFISDVSSILRGAGNSAAKAFKDFYESYFDVKK